MQQMRRERFGTDDDVFAGSEEFQEEWFGVDEDGNSLHEVGLRGGWDAKKRDEELSADGVTGEVVFPGPDAVTGKMGAPFGAGFAIDSTADPELVLAGARCVQPVGGRALRREPAATRRSHRRADPR